MTTVVMCLLLAASPADADRSWLDAAAHAERAHALLRCARGVLDGWWAIRDPETSLLTQHVDQRSWTVQNAAADLFPFLVATAHVTQPERLEELLVTLRSEIALTTRIGPLPDGWDLTTRRFTSPEADLGRIIFGAAEYCKDGLLPVCDLLGRGVWFQRMEDLQAAIFEVAPVETPYGRLPAADAEVNGDELQVLSRLWWATGDRRYLDWATRIGLAFCLEVLPNNHHLPAHHWDFENHRPADDRFLLNDHGNEIILGLAEWFAALSAVDPAGAALVEPELRAMFDRLLEVARNDDGMWFNLIRPSTGEVLDRSTPDTWGYTLCGYYLFGQTVGEPRYLAAVDQALAALANPRYDTWRGADAYADSLESGLYLLNRVPSPVGFAWLDRVTPTLLAMQRADGIIEGWYGDGNTARTCLQLAAYHQQGTRALPWRDDLRLGAVRDGDALRLSLTAADAWSGRVKLDFPRWREHFRLPIDYPRLNQFPEWYVVERTALYEVEELDGERRLRLGEELIAGLPMSLEPGQRRRLIIRPHGPPPHGDDGPRIAGPGAVVGGGGFRAELTVSNPGRRTLRLTLTSDRGIVTPAAVELAAGGEQVVELTGRAETEGTVQVRAVAAEPWLSAGWTGRIIIDPLLVGFHSFSGGGTWHDEAYQWTGDGPLDCELTAAEGELELVLRWGAKGDQRTALVTLGETSAEVTRGGWDGFEPVVLPVPAGAVRDGRLRVRLAAPAAGPAAFVSEARLRRKE